MAYTHILWDFNGTLINDVEDSIKTINILLQRRNIKTIDSKEAYHKVFCFPIATYYKQIGFDFEKEPFDDIAVEWIKEYLDNTTKTSLYDGVREVLSTIKEKEIPQLVLSATESEMLKRQVKALGISQYFIGLLGLDNIHAHSKVEIAKTWVEKEKPGKAVLIGDTVHDFEVAQAMGIECILIANGHQSKAALVACGVLVIDDIKEVLRLL